MIDIHTHLLPGVDDGSPSIDVSAPILERFASEGVETVVCTPHLRASDARRAPVDDHRQRLAALRAAAPKEMRLLQGWEIMLDVPDADLTDPALALGDSSAVLVEFPRMQVPAGSTRELHRLRTSGIVPVLAHPERYWGCTPAQVSEWRNAGAVIQMDAATLLGGPQAARLSRELLERGLVDCIASDNHGDGRSLGAARSWLEEIGAEEQARVLTRANADRLLRNEPTLPVAPVGAIGRGPLRRLRELLLGRRA